MSWRREGRRKWNIFLSVLAGAGIMCALFVLQQIEKGGLAGLDNQAAAGDSLQKTAPEKYYYFSRNPNLKPTVGAAAYIVGDINSSCEKPGTKTPDSFRFQTHDRGSIRREPAEGSSRHSL
jgi:hypothetical protein